MLTKTCVVRSPLGERLRQCRAYAGLSQKQLSERTGIPKSKIGSLESGRLRGYLDEITTWVQLTGCGDQLAEILQCWREFVKPPRKPRTDEVIDYSEQT